MIAAMPANAALAQGRSLAKPFTFSVIGASPAKCLRNASVRAVLPFDSWVVGAVAMGFSLFSLVLQMRASVADAKGERACGAFGPDRNSRAGACHEVGNQLNSGALCAQMPQFFFRLRTPDAVHLPQAFELPDLRAALIAANSAARRVVRNKIRDAHRPLTGSFDVENDRHEPVARIMLADLARQLF